MENPNFLVRSCWAGLLLMLEVHYVVIIQTYVYDVGLLQIMTDPDAPSPSEPSLREWVHW